MAETSTNSVPPEQTGEARKTKKVSRVSGHGIVWNAKEGKALCQFEKAGYLDTDDKVLIKKLEEFKTESGKAKFPVTEIEVDEDGVALEDHK